ncbi:MAG: bifunctional riboflavin kinase/FAD synthetase [Bacteroidota bacterium]|jgi:riboflavin kinase/FMN adenylyltransferase
MNIYHSLDEIGYSKNTVISIGMFDGIHRAHQKIIAMVVEGAAEIKGRSMLITFSPHPRQIVGNKGEPIEILTTVDEKIQLFEKYGIEELFIIPFTYEFSQLSLEDFYSKYVIRGIGVTKVIEGNDHQLGKDRQGNIAQIRTLGEKNDFLVESVPIVMNDGEKISSSEIRRKLHLGEVSAANDMLGREYSFEGIVVRGYGRGKKLGYPTANIKIDDPQKLIPKIGVYAVYFFVGGTWYEGMMSIGHNPTFHENHERTTEVNIFNFDRDIYDQHVIVRCIERTRDEKKFSDVGELITEMGNDKVVTQKILEHYKLKS